MTPWQKIKSWTRWTVFILIALVLLIVLAQNYGTQVEVQFLHIKRSASLLLVLLIDAILSIFGWWILWLSIRAVRQMRDARLKGRVRQLEEMQAKAAMLQTKPGEAEPPTRNAQT